VMRADVHPRAHATSARSSGSSRSSSKRYAYEAGGDVYFDTQAYPGYASCPVRIWRPGGRRPHRGGRRQAQPHGFCPLEGAKAR
jgi:hypothetical protein